MGASTSHQRNPILPQTAGARFPPEFLKKVFEAFKRATGGKDILRLRPFLELVLHNVSGMPPQVARQVFNAFDYGDVGFVDWNNFISTLSVLCHGTPEEQTRLLFYICNKSRTGECTRAEFVSFARLFNHKFVQKAGWLLRSQLDELFPRPGSSATSSGGRAPELIDEQEFVQWALHPNQRQSNMIVWISEFGSVLLRASEDEAIYRESDPATQRQKLASSTHFSLREVEWLQNRFTSFETSTSNPTGLIGSTSFHQLFSDALPETLRDILFHALVRNNNTGEKLQNVVSTQGVIQALSCCSRGSFEEQIDFCFSLFDTDNNGTLSRKELAIMVSALGEFHPTMDSIGNKTSTRKTIAQAKYDVDAILLEFADVAPAQNTVDGEEEAPHSLSRSRFAKWVASNPILLTLLDGVRQVSNLDLGVRPLDEEQERSAIKKAMSASSFNSTKLIQGQTWFVLSEPWFRSWSDYVDLNGVPTKKSNAAGGKRSGGGGGSTLSRQISRTDPGPIDNMSLLQRGSSCALRPELKLGVHFRLVNEKVWEALSRWYGGAPRLSRHVIETENGMELELYPIMVRINKTDHYGHALSYGRRGTAAAERELLLSRIASVAEMKRSACHILHLNPKKVRVWDCGAANERQQYLIEGQNGAISEKVPLEDLNLVDGQLLLLEQADRAGKWPRGMADGGVYSVGAHGSLGPASSDAVSSRAVIPGVCGLNNLGNTCYMNASLQCLGHVRPFVEYFRSNAYVTDIHQDAMMGSRMAEFADGYGTLVTDSWGAQAPRSSVAPRHFKKVLGRFKEAFVGYEQQDAQEFLSTVFDGLGEDLNRVKKKPYIEQPDSEGRSDDIVANIWWANVQKRENSIIQALFTGQFKSLVRCQACLSESSRFEPFSFVQLPLPDPMECTLQMVLFYRGNSRQPLHCSVRVPIKGPISDVFNALEELQPGIITTARNSSTHCLSSNDLYLTYIRAGKPVRVDLRTKSMAFANNTLLCCYQLQNLVNLPTVPHNSNSDSNSDSPPTFDVHDRVLSLYKGDTSSWFAGCIIGKNEQEEDGSVTFAVQFDDGDYDKAVKQAHIKVLNDQLHSILVTAYHRRFESIESSNRYFWNSLQPAIFGFPVMLRIIPKNITGYDLYRQVWEHTRHLLPGDVREAPLPLSTTEDVQSLSPAPIDAKSKGPFLGNARFLHSGDGYPVLDWGFQLRRVTSSGLACPRTEWTRGCLGTELADGVDRVHLLAGTTLAIDWDPSVASRLRNIRKTLEVHSSVERCRLMDTKSLSMYECMDTFIKAEKLDGNDQVYCSKCKSHEDAMKRVTIYRPPPVLVIHLKRFKYTQYTRGKIARFVSFPLDNADLRFANPPKPQKKVPLDLSMWKFLGGNLAAESSAQEDETLGNDHSATCNSKEDGDGEETKTHEHAEKSAENNESTASAPPPVPLYDCIGVVNHYGDLGAGHYTAFAKNPYDGKWRQFDDNRVKIIDAQQVVTQHAYLLFYLRQDMRGEAFAPGFDYRMPTAEQMKEQIAMRKQSKKGRCMVQ